MTDLTPKVVVNGGFNKRGSIVEGDLGIEYERTGFCTVFFHLDINRHDVEFKKEDAGDEDKEIDELTQSDRLLAQTSGNYDDLNFDHRLKRDAVRNEYLYGKAHVEKASVGIFSFSMLGSAKEFTELSLQITRSKTDRLTIFGYRMLDEVLQRNEEGFGIEMQLGIARFDELRDKLRNKYTGIRLSVDLLGASRFFAEWSPHNDEGRVIKYLKGSDDLDNPKDLPEHFNLRNPRSMKFSLYMSSPLIGSKKSDIDTDSVAK